MSYPQGWSSNTLRDLAEINYGKSPSLILAEDAPYPVVGTGGEDRRGKGYLYDGESVILGRKGTIDRVNFISGRFWTIDTAYYLSDCADASVKWLYYYLSSVDLSALNEATGVPSLSRDQLYKISIPTPPKTEQTKIAEILSTVDRAIEQTEALIAKQQRIKTGLMQDLLTRGIDEHGTLRSEKTHKFKDSLLGRIALEWDAKPIGKVVSLQRGYDITEAQLVGGPFPVVSSSGVMGFHRDSTSSGPNVVVGRKGTIGKVQFLPGAFWAHDTSLFVTDFHGNHAKFIYHLFSHLDLARFGTKSGSPSLNRNDIYPQWIRVPPPEEQDHISRVLDAVDKDLDSFAGSLAKCKRLKSGLMQDLLTGKRCVTPLLEADQGVGETSNAA